MNNCKNLQQHWQEVLTNTQKRDEKDVLSCSLTHCFHCYAPFSNQNIHFPSHKIQTTKLEKRRPKFPAMSRYIPIVTQEEEEDDLTMVVRPPPPIHNTGVATNHQSFHNTNKTNLFPIFKPKSPPSKPTSKLVAVKSFTKRNGTQVSSHTRLVKVGKPTKSVKSSKSKSSLYVLTKRAPTY